MNNFPTIARGVCILQHVKPGDNYAISCGCPATHLVFHPSWGKAMESCAEIAYDKLDRPGYEVISWDWADAHPARVPGWVTSYIAEGGQS